MMRPRFYCDAIEGEKVELCASESRHLAAVRRLSGGDPVELFDGLGKLAVGTVDKADVRRTSVAVKEVKVLPRRTTARITIAVSIAKGARFDRLLAGCTELGVDRICPVIFERTVKQAENPRILERWEKIAIGSAKQCRRLFLPKIDGPAPAATAVANLRSDFKDARFIVGSLSSDAAFLADTTFGGCDVVAFIGPEGGFSEQEERFLKEQAVEQVQLGDTVLRVETAALAFAAILTARRNAVEHKSGVS